MEWQPSCGLNVIVGAGDTCKTTILEAIAAVLSPAPNLNLSEFDYYRRDATQGFTVEAALAVDDGTALKGDRFPLPPLRGWKDGHLRDLPDEDGAEAVLVCRLTGTPEFEAIFEVVGADEETRVPLSRALRQRIGLVRLGVADRGDRDLRLVMGGALDRFMEGQQLRQSILQAVLKTPIHDQLGTQPKKALKRIEDEFRARSLPHPVRLGLIGTPGVSLAASVGLMVGDSDETALPLPACGMGTRRLASLALASIHAESSSLAVVDEPESGLEPYRQRAFIGDLHQGGKRQAFITTHAPAVLSAGAAAGAVIWRINPVVVAPAEARRETTEGEDGAPEIAEVGHSHILTALEGTEIRTLLKSHPEAVLARLPVICEGITEVGFATKLFAARFGDGFPARGIFCVDAGGHDKALAICRKLIEAGFQIAAVVDDEGRKGGSWQVVGQKATLLQWEDGAALEVAILTALPDDILPEVVGWPEEFSGKEVRHCIADLRRALGAEDKEKTAKELFAVCGRERFLNALRETACPRRKGDKKPKGWFKSFEGGYLLAEKLLVIEPKPQQLLSRIEEFLTAVEKATAV